MAQEALRGSSFSAFSGNMLNEVSSKASGDSIVEEVGSYARKRKKDLFHARSNDFDDDVIRAYETSNDEPLSTNEAPPTTSTPTDAPSHNTSLIGDAYISSGGYHNAPSRPTNTIVPSVEKSHHSSVPSAAPVVPTVPAINNSFIEHDLTPSFTPSSSSDYTNNTLIIARYHQEEVIAEANVDGQSEGNGESSEQLLPQELESSSLMREGSSKQIVPALLTGFASMVLFFALFLVCANQREQCNQRKSEREQMRQTALADDGSCGRSVKSSQAYSDPFDDVYGEDIEDGRSLYSRRSTKGGGGSYRGGSYWVQALVKKLADRNRNEEAAKSHQTNILPPLAGDEDNVAEDDETSFAGLSIVSSLTQSLMTFGSALWPSEEASLDLGPSSRRVAAQSKRSSVASSELESIDGEDSAIERLHQTNSNEDANGSVCSSLTDGTANSLKSAGCEEATVDIGMPAIDEDGVTDEEIRRISIFSSSTRKDVKNISTDSTQTPSTVLDDSSSLDLASELARLQNLIGSIAPGDDFFERDMVFKSLSEESFDLGVAEGQEEI